MTKPGFIRINEAVRVYDKTRQTFYNYINKEQVEAKKINNKLFLNVSDIERTLSEYSEAEKKSQERSQSNHQEPETISTTITPPLYNENPQSGITHEQMNEMLTRMDIVEDILHDLSEQLQTLPEPTLSPELSQLEHIKDMILRLQENYNADTTSYYHNLSQLIQLSFRHLHETLWQQHQEMITSIEKPLAEISLKKLRFRIYYIVFVLSNISILVWISFLS